MLPPFSCPETEPLSGLTWDTPREPPENSLAVVYEKTVVLVRHHFASKGDVEEIYNEYIDDKMK